MLTYDSVSNSRLYNKLAMTRGGRWSEQQQYSDVNAMVGRRWNATFGVINNTLNILSGDIYTKVELFPFWYVQINLIYSEHTNHNLAPGWTQNMAGFSLISMNRSGYDIFYIIYVYNGFLQNWWKRQGPKNHQSTGSRTGANLVERR